MSGPLAGIRVLDLTTVQMGPWCTRIMADFGADVIKVEAPGGDSSRFTGVPRNRGMSGTFQHNGRGKRAIALDLKQAAARDVVLRLVPGVQAFASNIRPKALARLGLDYESVRALNPTIVYLSMVGYGSGGRYAGRPARRSRRCWHPGPPKPSEGQWNGTDAARYATVKSQTTGAPLWTSLFRRPRRRPRWPRWSASTPISPPLWNKPAPCPGGRGRKDFQGCCKPLPGK